MTIAYQMYGHIRRTAASSDLSTIFRPRNWRIRLADFLVKIWLLNACLRLKPFAVFLKRLAAPLLVFILFFMMICLFVFDRTWSSNSRQRLVAVKTSTKPLFASRWEALFQQIGCCFAKESFSPHPYQKFRAKKTVFNSQLCHKLL